MDFEDLDALVVGGEINEENLVEAALANHLGRQQVDAVRGGGDEEAAGLLLHPGQEKSEDSSLLATGLGRGDAHLDFIEPKDRGGHVLHQAAGFDKCTFGLAVPAGKDLRSEERRVGKECRSRWSPYH